MPSTTRAAKPTAPAAVLVAAPTTPRPQTPDRARHARLPKPSGGAGEHARDAAKDARDELVAADQRAVTDVHVPAREFRHRGALALVARSAARARSADPFLSDSE